MSAGEIEAKERGVASSFGHPSLFSPVSASSTNNNVSIDIGLFVDRHNKLQELLYPFKLVGSAVVYVVRWENYLLTSAILLCLCVLFYYPAFLAAFLVSMAIAGMALGKYYSQTSGSRRRAVPSVDYLNEDRQELRRVRKEEKASHKFLLEYKQIISNVEAYMNLASYALEYLYRVVLWKSLEVSICVTVLLCVLLALICTVYLRVLFALVPLLVLCFNKHFLNRTVELWKRAFRSVKVRLKRIGKAGDKEVKKKAEGAGVSSTQEVVHHDQPETIDASTEVVPAGSAVLASDSDEGRGGGVGATAGAATGGGGAGGGGAGGGGASERFNTSRSSTLPSQGSITDVNGPTKEGLTREAATLAYGKGVCYKCNASFAKLLKRKHDCNYCGQSYCGSCTVKVKRAELGATSPAAFEESVRVCLDCKQRLDNLKNSASS